MARYTGGQVLYRSLPAGSWSRPALATGLAVDSVGETNDPSPNNRPIWCDPATTCLHSRGSIHPNATVMPGPPYGQRCPFIREFSPVVADLERETGLEPATTCLEGRGSTTELLPRVRKCTSFGPSSAGQSTPGLLACSGQIAVY